MVWKKVIKKVIKTCATENIVDILSINNLMVNKMCAKKYIVDFLSINYLLVIKICALDYIVDILLINKDWKVKDVSFV